MKLAEYILELLYPSTCPGCGMGRLLVISRPKIHMYPAHNISRTYTDSRSLSKNK